MCVWSAHQLPGSLCRAICDAELCLQVSPHIVSQADKKSMGARRPSVPSGDLLPVDCSSLSILRRVRLSYIYAHYCASPGDSLRLLEAACTEWRNRMSYETLQCQRQLAHVLLLVRHACAIQTRVDSRPGLLQVRERDWQLYTDRLISHLCRLRRHWHHLGIGLLVRTPFNGKCLQDSGRHPLSGCGTVTRCSHAFALHTP